jgi:hypothetical protein
MVGDMEMEVAWDICKSQDFVEAIKDWKQVQVLLTNDQRTPLLSKAKTAVLSTLGHLGTTYESPQSRSPRPPAPGVSLLVRSWCCNRL